jgi:hypothetical protein
MAVNKVTLEVGPLTTIIGLYKKTLIFCVGLSFIMAILNFSSFISTFFITLLMSSFLIGAISLYIVVCLRCGVGFIKKNQNKIEKSLKNQGFHIDFSTNGIIIDNTKKKIAFLSKDKPDVLVCDYTDIRSWHQETLQTTEQFRNQDNAYAGSKTTTQLISIVVYLSSPEYPEARFQVINDREATTWLARLNALVNC